MPRLSVSSLLDNAYRGQPFRKLLTAANDGRPKSAMLGRILVREIARLCDELTALPEQLPIGPGGEVDVDVAPAATAATYASLLLTASVGATAEAARWYVREAKAERRLEVAEGLLELHGPRMFAETQAVGLNTGLPPEQARLRAVRKLQPVPLALDDDAAGRLEGVLVQADKDYRSSITRGLPGEVFEFVEQWAEHPHRLVMEARADIPLRLLVATDLLTQVGYTRGEDGAAVTLVAKLSAEEVWLRFAELREYFPENQSGAPDITPEHVRHALQCAPIERLLQGRPVIPLVSTPTRTPGDVRRAGPKSVDGTRPDGPTRS